MSTPSHTFYTTRQLEKLHRQLAHPSTTKLYELLKAAGTYFVTPEILGKLDSIVAQREPCQKVANAP